MSAVSAINRMGSTRLTDIDQVIHLIWNFKATVTRVPSIFNEEVDIES